MKTAILDMVALCRDFESAKHLVDEVATTQITKMEQLLERVEQAQIFIRQLTAEKLEELKEPLAWRNYEELNYVFAMNELF